MLSSGQLTATNGGRQRREDTAIRPVPDDILILPDSTIPSIRSFARFSQNRRVSRKKKTFQDNFGCSAWKISLDVITCVWPLRTLVGKKVCPHKITLICHVVFVLRLSRQSK